tara:strand:- start:249 stop:1175 length:927 start_codon:yes stop_codon:yes gene_type:complete
MNVALSGSNGFIGSQLKSHLKSIKEINLILLQRKKNNEMIADQNLSYEDFFDCKLNKKIDIFIHLASPNFDNEKDDILEKGIVHLTKRILNTLPSYNCSKFIYFSTCKVYGEPSLHKKIFDENFKPSPRSDYSRAKLKAENIIKSFSISHKINFLIYRLSFVYGVGMKSNLSYILKVIDKSLPLIVPNDNLLLSKSFLYVESINKVIRNNILNLNSINNEIINLSDKDPISLGEFIKHYRDAIKSRSFIWVVPNMIFNFLCIIPYIKILLIKIYGGFEIDNKKIKTILNDDIIGTQEGIIELTKKKNL